MDGLGKSDHTPDWHAEAILDAIGTAVVLLGADRSVQGMNAAAQELLSVSARLAIGRPIEELLRLPSSVNSLLTACLEEGSWSLSRAEQLQKRTGESLTVDLDVQPFGKAGALLQLVGLEGSARIARETAMTSQNASGQMLLRGLAHEVKNPLGGLRGAAQLLESELPDASLREYTQIIISEADRLHRLIDRMSGPQTAPSMKLLNIHRVTEHVRQLLEVDCPTGVDVSVSYDPSLPRLKGDFEWLVQMLLNLGLNAIQAVGMQGRIQLITRARSNFVIRQKRHRLVIEIQVLDDGPGIEDEMLNKMFLPMVTGRSEGTGLGLSIAQNLVTHHDGVIECVSRVGQTAFSVYLPLEQGID